VRIVCNSVTSCGHGRVPESCVLNVLTRGCGRGCRLGRDTYP
jgi:hypothetical protein